MENGSRTEELGRMSEEELLSLLAARRLKPYQLEKDLGDSQRAVNIRRAWLCGLMQRGEEALGNIPTQGFDYSLIEGACAENVVGYVPVPVGYAGPLRVNGEDVFLPLATTEGCLIASTHRGCLAIANGEGIRSQVYKDGMTRGAVVRFPSLVDALEFVHWSEQQREFRLMKQKFEETSRFARLTSVKCNPTGRLVFIRFTAKTGDAMGMNMVSKGTEAVVKMLSQEYFPKMVVVSLSGNYCVDKKSAAINWIEGRGKSVVAEAIVPASAVSAVLKTSVKAMVELGTSKNLVGSALAGTMGGYNAHAANIVTALFIATGQDVAQNISSSNCMTLMEEEANGDLYISVKMPSLEVGTVGGGTFLPPQAAALSMLGCGGEREVAGRQATRLAEIVAAAVLAAELSLMAALSSGDLVRSHLRHNRWVGGMVRAEVSGAGLRSSLMLVKPEENGLQPPCQSSSFGSFTNSLAHLTDRSLKGSPSSMPCSWLERNWRSERRTGGIVGSSLQPDTCSKVLT